MFRQNHPAGVQKIFTAGPPHIYRASAAPWDFQPQGSFCRTEPSWRSLELHKHHRALGLAPLPTGSRTAADIAKLRPVQPVTLLRPHAARRAARFFVEKFPGRSLYAVKANPSPDLLQILWEAGVTHYDVASIGEVRLVAETLPEAVLVLHAPGEGRGSDRRGLFRPRRADLRARYRWRSSRRSFARPDRRRRRDRSQPAACASASARTMPSSASPSKFGAEPHEVKALAVGRPPGGRRARHLLPRRQPGDDARRPMPKRWRASAPRSSRPRSRSTSSMSAAAFRRPIRAWSRRRSRPISRSSTQAFEALPISYSAELWCEPGRALCAEYASLLVRVEKRRGDELYINDGAYGALFDAAHIGWRYPGAADPRADESTRAADGVQLLRPDLRRSRPYGRAVRAARRRRGRRLYRDRHARRLWLRDAHRVQRLRHGRARRSSTTSRWRASTSSRATITRSNVVKL